MRISIAAGILLYSTASFAAGEQCIKVETDLDRLACYDKELGRTSATVTAPASAGEWQVLQQTSKMTDGTDVALSVDSQEAINCGWNKGAKISMLIRCKEGRTSLYIATGCHMVSSNYNDYGDIEYRIDSDKARTVSADASTDNKALGLWSGGKAIPVVKQMLGKTTFIARMTPFSESPFTATFNIAGLDTAIAPLRKACKW